jgi:hypothetical protein
LYTPNPARMTVCLSNGLQASDNRGCGRNFARLTVKSESPTWGRQTFGAGCDAHTGPELLSA